MKSENRVQARKKEKQLEIALSLSQEAKENLEKLRVKFLDRQGREPSDSQIIERLLRAAVESEIDAPYPNTKGRTP
jgi:hypothetical protein